VSDEKNGDSDVVHVESVVSTVIAGMLTASGALEVSADALMSDDRLRNRDFTSLGVGSLDWMESATRLEEVFGIEFPDEAFLDSAGRTVATWTTFIRNALAAIKTVY
jgi:acyl carrier protein